MTPLRPSAPPSPARTDPSRSTVTTTRALRGDWAASALAGWDEDDAVRLSELVERLIEDLDTSARTAGRPAATQVAS